MSKTKIIRISGAKLHRVSEKIFQEKFIEIAYNDHSPLCAMVRVDTPKDGMIDLQNVKSLQYYGYQTTHIQVIDKSMIFYVYQMQENNTNDVEEARTI